VLSSQRFHCNSPAIIAAVVTAALLMLAAGCGVSTASSGASSSSTTQYSSKGYELYSWEDGGQWYFSLLVGTNRMKAPEEIRSCCGGLVLDQLRGQLLQLPAGQFVTWLSGETLAFPPDDVVGQVRRICSDRGLQLTIAQ
jgi:hypothetical protein